MDLEEWVISLFNDIKRSAEVGQTYDLHLEPEVVKELADEWDFISNVELS